MVFEKVFKRLQFMVAKLQHEQRLEPAYAQFYNDLYSGKFAIHR